jgi:hypothetical protein
VAQVN